MIFIHDVNSIPEVLCPGVHYAARTTVCYMQIHDEIKDLIIKSFTLGGVPAGFTRGKLSFNVDKLELGITDNIYERGINPIQYFRAHGSVLYGARYIDHDLKIKRMGCGDNNFVFDMEPFRKFISPYLTGNH